MIRPGEKQDRETLEELFNLCFPGDAGFTRWFFQRVWRPDGTLVWQEEGIQAMLQLLPVRLRRGERTCQGFYVYGVGTRPAFRGRGIGGKLLETAREKGLRQGMDLMMLIPQEPSLFDYYRRFGYHTAFWVEEKEVKARREEEAQLSSAREEDLPEAAELYRRALGSLFCVDRTVEEFSLQRELYGGNALVLRRDGRMTAWGCIEPVGEGWRVAEALGPDAACLAAAALERAGAQGGVCRFLPGAGSKPFAMALPLSQAGEECLEEKQGYCNLLFN